ncbi:MAG: hypothetical protein MN733_25855, partial [Nitrososphaera sp.]|nr:hypothetical protein [Nitrososphaera sp.]
QRARVKGKQIGGRPIEDLRVGYILERRKEGDSLREIKRKYREKFDKRVSVETIRRYLQKME